MADVSTAVTLPKELHTRLKVRAAEQGRHMKEYMIEGLELVLGNESKPKKEKESPNHGSQQTQRPVS